MIVESPAKAKKIAGILGAGWIVEASYGHICDLPKNEIGVIAPSYEPVYEVGERSAGTVAKLKKLAQQADEIYLAPDPDREGEAIAWHLARLFCANKPYKRVTFNEITQTAIEKSLQSYRLIDENVFLAQQGRRVLDRLYGYKLSPVLSNKLNQRGVSAGRVQSVALRFIADRERQIQHFVPVTHYGVTLVFNDGNIEWSAEWDTSDLVTDEMPYIIESSVAVRVQTVTEQAGVSVTDFSEKERSRKPPAPLITSTLQQAAANKLHFSVKQTMDAAQKLFESGLITYHRTDNPNLCEDAIHAVWAFLREAGQAAHIPEKAHRWKSKADAQEAHEAIRPTDFTRRTADTGDSVCDKLYLLIWRAAVACQMKPAIYKVRKVSLQTLVEVDFSGAPLVKKQPATFIATGSEVIYPGWLILMKDDYTNEDSLSDKQLPPQPQGKELIPAESHLNTQETKPARRFSETSLVKMLEREGIGRPSTYASIIETLLSREYVKLEGRVFKPTPLGHAVVDALTGRFEIMETAYTCEMENQLDEIAQGHTAYLSVVGGYDVALDAHLQDFQTADIKPFGQDKSYPCPECEDGQLRRLKGKHGYFWGCSNYKAGCQCMRPDNNGRVGEPQAKKALDKTHKCPECEEGYLQKRKGKKGIFWGCSGYPKCKHTEDKV